MSTYTFRGFHIPERMMGGITRYIEQGVPPGDFLTAIICNDLYEAVGRADDENIANIPAYVGYFYNNAPSQCWGSVEKFNAWMDSKRTPVVDEIQPVETEVAIMKTQTNAELIAAYHEAAKTVSQYNAAEGGSYRAEGGSRGIAKRELSEVCAELRARGLPLPEGDYLL